MVRVQAASRIHCLLLDLGRATAQAYGGAGFMINGPGVVVRTRREKEWGFTSRSSLDLRTMRDIRRIINTLSVEGHAPIFLDIESAPLQHVGLGSKTAILLAAIVALHVELGIPYDRDSVALISGRGGTSGIGVHGFFDGGFLVDCGHPQGAVESLLPSSGRRPSTLPDLNIRIPIPASWRFHLLLPSGTTREGEVEKRFFLRHTPIVRESVFESIALVYHSMVPAIRRSDIAMLKRALLRAHEIGFKAKELETQSAQVRRLYEYTAKAFDRPVGLSSLGPLIYVILDEQDFDLAANLKSIAERFGAKFLGVFEGFNRGHIVTDETVTSPRLS